MRCIAPISDRSLLIRARLSEQDTRCLRSALPGRKLCHQHASIHDRIVARILSIPTRAIYSAE